MATIQNSTRYADGPSQMQTDEAHSQQLVPILTHTRADFDALASLLAASLLYPHATPVLPHTLGRGVSDFLTLYRNLFPFITADEWANRVGQEKVTQAIVVDTQKFNYVKGMTDETPRHIIDHHPLSQKFKSPPAGWTVSHEPLGANVTLLIERLIEREWALSSAQATLMALGIHTDTGSLTYGNTTARDAAALAWLMQPEHEVNLSVLTRFLNYPLNEAERALLKQMVDGATWSNIGNTSLLFATASVPKFSGSLATLATRLRDTFDPDVLFLLVKIDDYIQVVARSRAAEIDVGQVTKALGGGGHARAAAAAIDLTKEQTDFVATLAALPDKIRTLIENDYQPTLTVADIMTHGRPRTLPADLPVGTAIEHMKRYGHEGFPVVETWGDSEEEKRERLVGVFTRRQADRAMNHRLHKEPIHRFMQAGHIFVHPDDSVKTLHRTMIDSGWGQVPVLAPDETLSKQWADQLIGIVTRTDLIKTWGQGDAQSGAQHPGSVATPRLLAQRTGQRHADLLRDTLPPAQHALLQHIGRRAAEQGLSTYVVGGFVRDLLLRGPNGIEVDDPVGRQSSHVDIDIVFEGDAMTFAEQMKAQHGGRLVTHARFGTAKWILHGPSPHRDDAPVDWPSLLGDDATEHADLPPHIDLISARTEFYEEPSALPTVERSSIKLDLHRRDFTINTLALSLHPAHWAKLYDFYDGFSDLQRGVVRVLHSLSFVDDPTRILRGVRYEQRFGFHIEERTLDLLRDALDLLERVTSARINHELERILQETQPEQALARLDELGVLAALHPALTLDERVAARFQDLRFTLHASQRDGGDEPTLANYESEIVNSVPVERLYWALLVWPLDPAVDDAIAERLSLRQETQRLVADMRQVQAARAVLTRDAAPSTVVQQLRNVDEAAVVLAMLVWQREQGVDYEAFTMLKHYLDEWRHVRPELDGNALQNFGIPPGPRYAQILRTLLHARLDGKITTRSEEVALAKSMAEVQ